MWESLRLLCSVLSFLWFSEYSSRVVPMHMQTLWMKTVPFAGCLSELHAHPTHLSSCRQARQVQVREAATPSPALGPMAVRVAVLTLLRSRSIAHARYPSSSLGIVSRAQGGRGITHTPDSSLLPCRARHITASGTHLQLKASGNPHFCGFGAEPSLLVTTH